MDYTVRILAVVKENENCKRFFVEKPEGYLFEPGQSTEISLTRKGLEEFRKPFSFVCCNTTPNLEFIIKDNGQKTALGNWLSNIKPGEKIIIREAFGGLRFMGEGYFIAGGTGITPFLSIFKKLKEEDRISGNHLIFSTRNRAHQIAEKDLTQLLGTHADFHFSRDPHNGFRRLNQELLAQKVLNTNKFFYICGPETMIDAVRKYLLNIGARPERIVTEIFFDEKRHAA